MPGPPTTLSVPGRQGPWWVGLIVSLALRIMLNAYVELLIEWNQLLDFG